jgi:hypothetical protein
MPTPEELLEEIRKARAGGAAGAASEGPVGITPPSMAGGAGLAENYVVGARGKWEVRNRADEMIAGPFATKEAAEHELENISLGISTPSSPSTAGAPAASSAGGTSGTTSGGSSGTAPAAKAAQGAVSDAELRDAGATFPAAGIAQLGGYEYRRQPDGSWDVSRALPTPAPVTRKTSPLEESIAARARVQGMLTGGTGSGSASGVPAPQPVGGAPGRTPMAVGTTREDGQKYLGSTDGVERWGEWDPTSPSGSIGYGKDFYTGGPAGSPMLNTPTPGGGTMHMPITRSTLIQRLAPLGQTYTGDVEKDIQTMLAGDARRAEMLAPKEAGGWGLTPLQAQSIFDIEGSPNQSEYFDEGGNAMGFGRGFRGSPALKGENPSKVDYFNDAELRALLDEFEARGVDQNATGGTVIAGQQQAKPNVQPPYMENDDRYQAGGSRFYETPAIRNNRNPRTGNLPIRYYGRMGEQWPELQRDWHELIKAALRNGQTSLPRPFWMGGGNQPVYIGNYAKRFGIDMGARGGDYPMDPAAKQAEQWWTAGRPEPRPFANGGQMVVGEPTVGIGMQSGEPKFTLGEPDPMTGAPRPEMLNVTPLTEPSFGNVAAPNPMRPPTPPMTTNPLVLQELARGINKRVRLAMPPSASAY